MPLSRSDRQKKTKKESIEDIQQKYISAPNEKLRKFYRDILIKLGGKVPKL